MADIFSLVFGREKSYLTEKFKDFESRPQQIQMVKAIQKALNTKENLLVEAGTGVGKSLAYLLPIIHWTVEKNKKVVISTYTKTLQEQLVKKDIPYIKSLLDIDFKFALCVGSQNYLCLRRFKQQISEPGLFIEEVEELDKIKAWAQTSKIGQYTELKFLPKEIVWNKICRESDLCLGKDCIFKGNCFYQKAKQQEYKAQILITNHHLFFAHIASGGKVLPSFQALVFDEAHTLEDVATSYLGIDISNFQLKYLLDSLYNSQSGKGFLWGLKGVSSSLIENTRKRLEEVRDAAQLFFSEIIFKFGETSHTIRIKEPLNIFNHLNEPLKRLATSLEDILAKVEKDDDKLETLSYISKVKECNRKLAVILTMSLEKHVYWLEIINRPRWGIKYIFSAAPIDIASEFKIRISDPLKPIVFTSATLAVNGNFEFIKKNLGIDDRACQLILDSPFNYQKNVMFYTPKDMPDPTAFFKEYQTAVLAEIKKIISFMQGRTFILFTNFKAMDLTYQELKDNFAQCHILKQGLMPRYKLLEIFKHNNNAILLGTNTFWQGIDIPGKALECVIITKLPFAVPDEPIIEAKMEFLLTQGKEPFYHYQLPRAAIMFKQGFGRLIRTNQDRGMVAVLDPRIKTRFYGHTFLDILPRCREIIDLKEAQDFLQKV